MEESQQGFIVFAKGIGGFTAHLLVTDFPILIVDSEEQASGIIGALKDTGYSDLEFSFQPFTALDQIKRAGHEVVIDKALDGEYGEIARDLCKMAKEIFRRSGGRRVGDENPPDSGRNTNNIKPLPTVAPDEDEGEGNGGAGQTPKKSQSTKPADKTPRRGRPVDQLTVQRADFAKPLRERENPQTWENIATAYRKKHPKDLEASADTLRLAFQRQYPEPK